MRKNIAKVIAAFQDSKPAKGGDSCSTDGKTIYSYTTPIAKRLPCGRVVLIPGARESYTTKCQINAVRYALAELLTCVDHEDCLSCPALANACARAS